MNEAAIHEAIFAIANERKAAKRLSRPIRLTEIAARAGSTLRHVERACAGALVYHPQDGSRAVDVKRLRLSIASKKQRARESLRAAENESILRVLIHLAEKFTGESIALTPRQRNDALTIVRAFRSRFPGQLTTAQVAKFDRALCAACCALADLIGLPLPPSLTNHETILRYV